MAERAQYSAIILAGGKSLRMGRAKAGLLLGATTMLDRIVSEMTRSFEELIVAVSAPRLFAWENVDARTIVDRARYRGPAAALEQALREIQFDRAFVCSCDLPFVNGDLARKLCGMPGEHDALLPRIDGVLQPLHAVYRKTCVKALAEMSGSGEHRLHGIVNYAEVRVMGEDEIRALDRDPELLSFFNVNTPEDYQRALKLADARDKM